MQKNIKYKMLRPNYKGEIIMKNSKKLLALLVSMLMLATMLVGCGGPKITPDESATIVLDIILKGDNSKLDSVKMTQEEFDKVRKSMEDAMMTQFDSAGVSLKDETKTNLLNAILEAMKKVTYEVKTTSEEKEQATVEVSIKGIDIKKVSEELQADVTKYATENPTITQDELFDYTFNKEAELIKNGSLAETPKTITMTLTKQDNVWVPNESDMFKIGTAVMSY